MTRGKVTGSLSDAAFSLVNVMNSTASVSVLSSKFDQRAITSPGDAITRMKMELAAARWAQHHAPKSQASKQVCALFKAR
jgi:hypothetical protein